MWWIICIIYGKPSRSIKNQMIFFGLWVYTVMDVILGSIWRFRFTKKKIMNQFLHIGPKRTCCCFGYSTLMPFIVASEKITKLKNINYKFGYIVKYLKQYIFCFDIYYFWYLLYSVICFTFNWKKWRAIFFILFTYKCCKWPNEGNWQQQRFIGL